MYPDSLKNLIESFENFPGIGEKTAERMAFSVLSFDEDKFKLLQENLEDVKIIFILVRFVILLLIKINV